MIDTNSIDLICDVAVAAEAQSQCASCGRFASRSTASLGSVAGGQLTKRVTDYVSASGPGYVVTFTFTKDGQTWRRTVNFGPERHREMPWFKQTEPKVR